VLCGARRETDGTTCGGEMTDVKNSKFKSFSNPMYYLIPSYVKFKLRMVSQIQICIGS